MLKNYLKIALRNLKKYKGYSAINILGLAVGIAVCMLIYQYVSYELSFDEYHSKSERIYRITLDHPQAHIALTPSMFLPTMKRNYPEVNTGVRLFDVGSFQPLIVQFEDKVFEERNVVYSDSTLFDVFDFEMLRGNPETALVSPYSVVLTRGMANKYFKNVNPLGKNIKIGNRDYEITGIIENIPDRSHFTFDFFISMSSRSGWSQLSDEQWRAANFFTYIVLDEQAKIEELDRKVDDYIREHAEGNEFAMALDVKFEKLTDIHLFSDVDRDIQPQGDIRYVVAASSIAILILIIACINYMNLATARSARRSREVGIRKVLGSDRRSLMGQFYGETAILTLIAIALTVVLIEFLMPWFNQITGEVITVNYASFGFWGMMVAVAAFVTVIAGSYPALMLSSFRPYEVLKSSKITGGNSGFRKALVIFQFTASIFLIISTMVIFKQMNFIQEKELGYKQDNVLVLTAYGGVEDRFEALHSELMQLPGIVNAALTSETPTNIGAGYKPDIEGIEEGSNFLVNALKATHGFTETLNINTIAGRSLVQADYERANQAEEEELAILVNEETARHFGLKPEELLGREVTIGGGYGNIVGVIENFHFTSLHKPIEPLFIFTRGGHNKLLISFNTSDIQGVLDKTRTVWNQLFPGYPFEYEFLDQEYDALYKQEAQAGRIFTSFAILAIFVACLGLVGLASYMVERRTREIGVRKVLGATQTQIIKLFSKDFVLLILIGFIISIPIAWYAMSRWLQNFAYSINIGWTVFLLAGLLTLIIALLTVSYQALKAARLDPVNSLRRE